MIGQNKLITKIESLTFQTCPRTILLVGEKGSGRHSITQILANHLEVPLTEFTKRVTPDDVEAIFTSTYPRMYLFDGDKILFSNKSEKEQNALLKLFEEPLNNAFLVMICENPSKLLPTIVNRCFRWNMELYTKEELMKFTTDERLVSLLNTPGQLMNVNNIDVDALEEFASSILDNIQKATPSNVFKINTKVDFGKATLSEVSYPLPLLLKCIERGILNRIADGNDVEMWFKIHDRFNALRKKLTIYINTEQEFNIFLFELRAIKRGEVL